MNECVICHKARVELYNINSLFVCLDCIADGRWIEKMMADRADRAQPDPDLIPSRDRAAS